MEFAGLKREGGGREVNAPSYCALPRRSSSPYMAPCDINCHQQHSHHYISVPAYAICQIAFFKVVFPAHSYSLYSFHLVAGIVLCGITVSALLF